MTASPGSPRIALTETSSALTDQNRIRPGETAAVQITAPMVRGSVNLELVLGKEKQDSKAPN